MEWKGVAWDGCLLLLKQLKADFLRREGKTKFPSCKGGKSLPLGLSQRSGLLLP